jgi:threonine/homoserine/homoserine lactone efflux protein
VDYLTFSVIMLLAQFSPGPDMLLLLKNAVNHPLRAGLWTVAGIATGLCVHTTLALTGLAIVIRDSATAARLLNLAGGLYLGWLAFQLLSSVRRPLPPAGAEGPGNPGRTESPLSDAGAYAQGLITNLLNPKAAVFLLGVLAIYAGPGSSAGRRLAFAAIVLGQAVVFWSLFVWLLKHPDVRSRYLHSERVLNLLFGLGLAAIAVAALIEAI